MSNEIKHSSIYLGLDFSDNLCHYKYIRKYKNAKGNTIYIYKINKAGTTNSTLKQEEQKKQSVIDKIFGSSSSSKTNTGTTRMSDGTYAKRNKKITGNTPLSQIKNTNTGLKFIKAMFRINRAVSGKKK